MDAAATLADLDGLPADGLTELDELAYALPTVDALNIGLAGTYAALMRSTTREPNAGPRTSGRRRRTCKQSYTMLTRRTQAGRLRAFCVVWPR